MPTTSSDDWPTRASDFGDRLGRGLNRFVSRTQAFWKRVTEGIEIQQLWAQFQAEARASYELYSKEVDWTAAAGETHRQRVWRITRSLFWAMMLKLSPARRLFLLIALVLAVLGIIDLRVNVGEKEFVVGGGELPLLLAVASLLILLALELADRVTMKRDLEIAREIQSWLTPSAPPTVPGADVAFAMRPANTVAGDYYDAFPLPSTDGAAPSGDPATPRCRMLLVVADVAGKSVPAALLMATFQASLRTLAGAAPSLAELVAGLNQYACAHSLGGRRFTTAFLAELDPASGALTYINAGHNWPILRHASGAMERLEAGGLPLGIMGEARYESGSASLRPGDLLVVFTDGLVEAWDGRGEEYGEPRLLAAVGAIPNGSASEALKRLMASVDGFVGLARQHDDITCLVLRALAP